jgi:peptidoglycan/xylan/chitin deacetylase (PgdA/CDA1 family)
MNNTRYEYSPIARRAPLRWPNGARVAVWVIPNVEHFHIDRPGSGAPPGRAPQVPDARNIGWRDYGLRVGIWRIMGMLDKYGIRATVALNAEVCDLYPAIVEEGVKRGWEFMGHGLTNSEPLYGLTEDEERDVIARTLSRIEQAVGRRPRGWLGPGLAENFRTPELLAEAGVEYVGDWCADDQPFPLRMERGALLAMPYTVELNDLPFFLTHSHTGREFYEAIRDQFDVLYQEGATNARVMAIALHTFVTGQPHRAKYLDQALAYVAGHPDVWLATGSEIVDAYRAQTGTGE